MTATSHSNAGFTMVEATVAIALALPLLLVIASAGRAVTGSFHAIDDAARTTDVVLRGFAQIERALRSGSRQTLRTSATHQDVRERRAAAIGDPIPMPSREPRQDLALSSLVGGVGPALQLPTIRHDLAFVIDNTERANGDDDDGDGLVDEGSLQLTRGDDILVLLDGVERCGFELEGRAIRISLQYAQVGHGGKLVRTALNHTVLLNNP